MRSSRYLLAVIEEDLPAERLEVFWQQLQGVDLVTVSMMELCNAYLFAIRQGIKTGYRISV